MNSDEIEIIELVDEQKTNYLDTYGENLTNEAYVTNPAIARDEEIKKLIVILLTPDKSALLIGKPGIGKTAIVEGLAYKIQKNDVPDKLKGYKIYEIPSSVLSNKIRVGDNEELIVNLIVKELKNHSKLILFIDEIHTLMGAREGEPLDLANILKPALDRGDIKVIGATTDSEYQRYVVRDRAFLRRFDRVDVAEPSENVTMQILMGSIPRIEKKTGIKFKYTSYIQNWLIEAIVSATSEYKRIYGLSAMYPDVAFSVLNQAFSLALFDNKKEVGILDVYNAIKTSKRIYPDSIVKELEAFRIKFKKICEEEKIVLPVVTIDEVQGQDLF